MMHYPKNITRSLDDLLGAEYVAAVCGAQARLTGVPEARLRRLAARRVAFCPPAFLRRAEALLPELGCAVAPALAQTDPGAATAAFAKATHTTAAPLSGLAFLRIGEDGRLYLAAKSEHYHASLGHQFPGYRLLEHAGRLGILNATHNNTRGCITRRLERELIRTANGIALDDDVALGQALASREPHVLNRVINLETGSLACEAALKMMLARFYQLDRTMPEPPYRGRTPVFLVMADRQGGNQANYHGTTVLTQTFRGLWPELAARLEAAGIYRVRPVAINDIADFRRAVAEFDHGPTKIAGFLHELILMNYGGIRLTEAFLQEAHALCHQHDIPTLVDEIQSCMWSPELFLFREYGLKPDFVSVGKGFPGGQYCASKILVSGHLDNLNLFGALVTNGQEELASLAYLITMAFARANGPYIRGLGELYENAVRELGRKYPRLITAVEGQRHLSTLFFATAEQTVAFCKHLAANGIDTSAQTYKADCPPAALTKLPLIATPAVVTTLIHHMDNALSQL
jgi:acetylornithine/succinyldiaminopimelate/putrescine aminotransferase